MAARLTLSVPAVTRAQAACTSASFPAEEQAAADAFADAYDAFIATDVPEGCPAGTELAPAPPPPAAAPESEPGIGDAADAPGGTPALPPSASGGSVAADPDTGAGSGSESGSATAAAGAEASKSVAGCGAAAVAAALAGSAALLAW